MGALSTLTSDDPQRIRSKALRSLMGAVDGDIGLFYRAVRHQGRPVLCDAFTENSDALGQLIDHYVSSGPPVGAACDESPAAVRARRGGWTLATPPARADQRFHRLLADFQNPDAFTGLPVYRQLYDPLGVVDQLRLLAYHDGAFVGWIGVMRRRGSPVFGSRDEHVATRLVTRTQRSLTAAVALATLGVAGPLHAVFNSGGGLECANPELYPWLNRDRLQLLKRAVREVDQQGVDSIQLDGVGIRWSRLASQVTTRYLAVIEDSAPIERLSLGRLSAIELEVARAAAHGLKLKEIAAERGVSINTIKFHLKNAYAELGASTRLELSRALNRSET